MPRTYAQIIDAIELRLMDGGIDPSGSANQVFATAELDEFVQAALAELSRYSPREVKEEISTVANSREITLTAENKRNLIRLTGRKDAMSVEYPVDEDPPSYHNVIRFGDEISLELDSAPSAVEDVYLFLAKVHIIRQAVTTATASGAVDAEALITATSIDLKGLTAGLVIPPGALLTLDGISGSYEVQAEATVDGTGDVTLTIDPGLAAQADADVDATLTWIPTTGAVKTTTAIDATSLPLKWLGINVIREDTILEIAGDATDYVVTAEATVTGGEATVSVYPALAEEATADTVVTITQPESSLDDQEEELLIDLAAGKAATAKSGEAYKQAIQAIDDTTVGLADIATMIGQAITDVASGRTEAAKTAEAIDLANAEVDKMADIVTQAVADLTSGRSYIGSIDTARAAQSYGSYAQAGITAARGDLETASGYFREATGHEANNTAYLQSAKTQIEAASASLANLRARTALSSAGRALEIWGRATTQEAFAKLRRLRQRKPYILHSRS